MILNKCFIAIAIALALATPGRADSLDALQRRGHAGTSNDPGNSFDPNNPNGRPPPVHRPPPLERRGHAGTGNDPGNSFDPNNPGGRPPALERRASAHPNNGRGSSFDPNNPGGRRPPVHGPTHLERRGHAGTSNDPGNSFDPNNPNGRPPPVGHIPHHGREESVLERRASPHHNNATNDPNRGGGGDPGHGGPPPHLEASPHANHNTNDPNRGGGGDPGHHGPPHLERRGHAGTSNDPGNSFDPNNPGGVPPPVGHIPHHGHEQPVLERRASPHANHNTNDPNRGGGGDPGHGGPPHLEGSPRGGNPDRGGGGDSGHGGPPPHLENSPNSSHADNVPYGGNDGEPLSNSQHPHVPGGGSLLERRSGPNVSRNHNDPNYHDGRKPPQLERRGDSASAAEAGTASDAPVKSEAELKKLIFKSASKEMESYVQTHGARNGDDGDACELGTADCKPFTPKEQKELITELGNLMFKLASTGKCTATRFNGSFCNRYGYCSVYETDGKPSPYCEPIDRDEMAKIAPLLEKQKDGSFEFTKPAATFGAQKYTIDDTPGTATSALQVKPDTLAKRSINSLYDVLANNDGGNAPAASDPKELGEQYRVQSQKLAEFSVRQTLQYVGTCDKGSAGCPDGVCKLGESGCKHLTKAQKAKMIEDMTKLNLTVMVTGACDPKDKDVCDDLGYCSYLDGWKNGKPNPACKEIGAAESMVLLQSIQNDVAIPSWKLASYAGNADLLQKAVPTADDSTKEVQADPLTKASASKEPVEEQAHLRNSGFDKRTLFRRGDAPKSLEQAREEIQISAREMASAEFAEISKHMGTCEQAGDIHCADGPCELGLYGCRPYNRAEEAQITEHYTQLIARVLSTGKCDPKNKVVCDASGHCDRLAHWQHGKPNAACTSLSDSEREALMDKLQNEFDRPEPPVKADSDVTKRSLFKRDGGSKDAPAAAAGDDGSKVVPAAGAGDKAAPAAGAGDKAAPAGKQDSKTGAAAAVGPEQVRDSIISESLNVAQTAVEEATRSAGKCTPSTSGCKDGTRTLGTSGCRPYTAQEKAAMMEVWSEITATVMSAGKCSPSDHICDADGYCDLTANWIDGKPNPACQELSENDRVVLFDKLQTQTDAAAGEGGKLQKRHYTYFTGKDAHNDGDGIPDKSKDDLVKRDYTIYTGKPAHNDGDGVPNKVETTNFYPGKLPAGATHQTPLHAVVSDEEVREFQLLCAKLVANPAELKKVTDKAGVRDPKAIARVRASFAQYAKDKALAKKVLQQAKTQNHGIVAGAAGDTDAVLTNGTPVHSGHTPLV